MTQPARPARPRLIAQAAETTAQEAASPQADLMLVDADQHSDLSQRDAIGAQQDHPGPARLTLGRRVRPHPTLQLDTLFLADLQPLDSEHGASITWEHRHQTTRV